MSLNAIAVHFVSPRAVTAHSSTREIVRELRTVNEDRHNQNLMPLSYGKFVAELEKRGL